MIERCRYIIVTITTCLPNLPCTPVALYQSPVPVNKHSVPRVLELVRLHLHTRFVTYTLGMSLDLYTRKTSITEATIQCGLTATEGIRLNYNQGDDKMKLAFRYK